MKYNLKELLENKKASSLNEDDREQLELIETMLQDKTWYNKVDPNTAASMLLFLGIPMEDLEDYYISLISNQSDEYYDQYQLIDEDKVIK